MTKFRPLYLTSTVEGTISNHIILNAGVLCFLCEAAAMAFPTCGTSERPHSTSDYCQQHQGKSKPPAESTVLCIWNWLEKWLLTPLQAVSLHYLERKPTGKLHTMTWINLMTYWHQKREVPLNPVTFSHTPSTLFSSCSDVDLTSHWTHWH